LKVSETLSFAHSHAASFAERGKAGGLERMLEA
jgi:hypothetical protein